MEDRGERKGSRDARTPGSQLFLIISNDVATGVMLPQEPAYSSDPIRRRTVLSLREPWIHSTSPQCPANNSIFQVFPILQAFPACRHANRTGQILPRFHPALLHR
jgi:hypothetical protein